jgi:hypothetical protein
MIFSRMSASPVESAPDLAQISRRGSVEELLE